jgi:hypothetical protein
MVFATGEKTLVRNDERTEVEYAGATGEFVHTREVSIQLSA